jgi:hypothetical protein
MAEGDREGEGQRKSERIYNDRLARKWPAVI